MDFDLFKDGKYVISSSEPIARGFIIQLVNPNCEFDYDSFYGCFSNDSMDYYEVEVTITNENLDDYIQNKSNNGGAYAYATGVVTSVTTL